MSMFVENIEKEHDEYGTFVFSEATQRDAMKIPKAFGKDLSELQEMADDDDGTANLKGNVDDINWDMFYDILANLIVEWPDDREITPENVAKLKIENLMWCMNQAFEVINESQVTEDEEKN